MESILELFFKSDLEKSDNNNKNNNAEISMNKHNFCNDTYPQTLEDFPSLNQGQKFNKYQNKITSKLEHKIEKANRKEGFENNSNIQETKKEYIKTLKEYNNLLGTVAKNTNEFVARSSPNNPYNNKILNWTDPSAKGIKMYVTNKGIARPIKSKEIYDSIVGKNGCPGANNMTDITLIWNSNYLIPGQVIPTNPSLIVGNDMKKGESCGFEGTNVFVNKLVGSEAAKYKGCYADDKKNALMTFIGNNPPPENFIQNGNFDQPILNRNTFKYYTNSYDITGWYITAVLLNNSSAWGYPMPYPSGDQCISLQKTHEISTNVDLQTSNSYILSFMSCGRNCCDRSGQSNPIDVFLDNTKIFSFTPPINKWTSYSTIFTTSKTGPQKIVFKGTWNSGDRSSAIQKVTLSLSGTSGNGEYTYDMCNQSAIDGQYKYFALQNINNSTGKGYCAVSNDFVSATKLGTSYKITGGIVLWSTNTKDIDGSSAQLSKLGQLVVYNNSNAVIYETPNNQNKNENGGNYQGCFADRRSRAMTWLDRGKYMTPEKCMELAQKNNFKYYGLQNSLARRDGSNNINECFGSNDLKSASKYGKSSNCRNVNGLISGGPWANAIYSTEPGGDYYLILQDDGNMCIYRGKDPNNNQGNIWCSKTNGKQRKPNPNFEAKKGKYGRNWIKVDEILAKGDFVGSNNGSIYLQMRNDGNLVLCTSDNTLNCQRMNDNNMAGGEGANALYELSQLAYPQNMSDIAYVDIDSTIYSYPETNIKLGTTYTQFPNSDSPGNDIANAAKSGTTVDECKEICNSNKDCYGFVFNKQTQTCYPKSKGMFPTGQRTILSADIADIYTRSKIVKDPNVVEGLETMNNIDTIRYENYDDSKKNISDRKKIADMIMTTSQKQQLEQISSRLNLLSKNISELTSVDQEQINKINSEIEKNSKLLAKQIQEHNNLDELKNIDKTYTLWKTEDRNLDNMLNDSNLNVLHENYNYILWTSLALGTLIITLKVTN